jgi:signal transduction histidine kinase
MGSLASILAHDFRNYLSGIGGLAALVAETMPADDERRDDLHLIERTVGEATSLTKNVLAFARPQDATAVADVADVFRDYLPILERVVGHSVRIRASRVGELQPVQIEPSSLGQVLVNLATNARQAMPEGGELSLDARTSDSGIVIRVRDTGTGMPPEVASRVFEPFFTTRGDEPGTSGGTGLGLSSVYTIVRRAGGEIAVASQPGAGTTFEITLPVARAA